MTILFARDFPKLMSVFWDRYALNKLDLISRLGTGRVQSLFSKSLPGKGGEDRRTNKSQPLGQKAVFMGSQKTAVAAN